MSNALKKTKMLILLLLIFATAFLLRTIKLNNVYVTSDDALYTFEALRIFNRSLFSGAISNNFFVGLIRFTDGFSIIFEIAVLAILKMINAPVTEFLMRLPLSFFGSLTPIAIYFLTKELTRKIKPALFLSLFITIGYFHVLDSRFLGKQHIVIPLCFSLFGIHFLIKYYETHKRYYGLIASFLLGFYIVSSLLYPAIVPLVIFVSFVYNTQKIKGFFNKLRVALRCIFRIELIIFPLLFYIPYLVAQLYTVFVRGDVTLGFVGHIFSKKDMIGFGFFLPQFLNYLSGSYGRWLFPVFIVGVGYGLYCLIKLRNEVILFFWFLAYSVPFVFLSRGEYWYLLEAMIPLILISGLGVFRIFDFLINKYKRLNLYFNLFLAVVLIFVFLGTLGVVFRISVFEALFPEVGTESGIVHPDTGIKAAGYFIRKNILSEKKIFTDVESLVSHLYFNRINLYTQFDLSLEQNLEYFKEVKDKVDMIVVNAKYSNLYLNTLGNLRLFKLAEIVNNNKPLIYIYAKYKTAKVDILETKETNKLFDREFGKVDRIISKDMSFPLAYGPVD